MAATRKQGLDPSLRRLVDLIEGLDFGRINGLRVRDGLPLFDPPPKVYQEVRLKVRSVSRRGTNGELPEEFINLILQLRLLENGLVDELDVKYGLPFRLVVERLNVR